MELDSLIEQAHEFFLNGDYYKATECYQHSLQGCVERNGVAKVEVVNGLLDCFKAFIDNCESEEVEREFIEKSKALLTHFIGTQPSDCYSWYFDLAQFEDDVEKSLALYERGSTVLINEIIKSTNEEEKQVLLDDFSNGCCGAAEIALQAEEHSKCEEWLHKCRTANTNIQNASFFRLCASLAIDKMGLTEDEKSKASLAEDARVNSFQAVRIWRERSNEVNVTVDEGIELCKVLLELSLGKYCKTIVHILLHMDDENIDVWFLYGLSFKCCNQHRKSLQCLKRAARLSHEQSIEMNEELKTVLAEEETVLGDVAAHISDGPELSDDDELPDEDWESAEEGEDGDDMDDD